MTRLEVSCKCGKAVMAEVADGVDTRYVRAGLLQALRRHRCLDLCQKPATLTLMKRGRPVKEEQL